MKSINLHFLCLSVLFLIGACSITAISPDLKETHVPEAWGAESDQNTVRENWLTDFADEELVRTVEVAMERNFQLAEQAARVREAREAVIVSGAARYPELNFSFAATRQQLVFINNPLFVNNNFDLSLDASWEIDIWGRLSDTEKQASLNFLAQEAGYIDARYRLAADVARGWYNVIGAAELLALFEKRLETLHVDVDIIERGYRQGINSSLDVYLTRTTLEQERARVARQRQILQDNAIALQLLQAHYPDGNFNSAKKLPIINENIPLGLPSELLARRPDLQQAWLNLLATDAGLAVAHKQRFPRISLTAGISDISNKLGELLNGSPIGWSLLGNLTQPIFNAGRLKALEGQARERVVQAEKQYLARLYQAFSEVENTLSRNRALNEQYRATLATEKNAESALTLSFEQYQRGLVSYATVLESQRRAFDAQSSVIDLRNQLLQNRIAIYQALGGSFEGTTQTP